MAEKTVKLVLSSKNEQSNYTNGVKTGQTASMSYNMVTETESNIGNVNISASYYQNDTNSEYNTAVAELMKKIEDAFEQFNNAVTM